MVEGKVRVQAADDVELRCAFANALLGALINLFQRKSVGTRGVGIAAKRTQPAVRHADVGRINVAVDVEIRHVPVALLANVVGQPAHRQQVRRAVKQHAVVNRKPFTSEHFARDGLQPLVGDDQFAHFDSIENVKRAKPLPQRPKTTRTTY